jgi:uncharacterized protein DUF927
MAKKQTKVRSKVTSRLKFAGEGRDEYGTRYFKFRIRGGAANVPPFAAEQIIEKPTAVFAELTNAGANAFTNKVRNDLLEDLQARKPEQPSFKVVTRLGWQSGAIVRPEEMIGDPKEKLEPCFRDLDQQMLGKYRTKGSLQEWQNKIGALCRGNRILMFAASLACAGPILSLVKGPRSGGFQLSGPPETGKTGAAMLAVWGCHRSPGRKEKGFAESWHTTAGKVEITALAHNHSLLILDETKRAGRTDQQRAQVVADVAVGLAEYTEREQLNNQGPARAWELYFFSTSNLTLDEIASRGGITIDDAERGRMTDIPVPNDGHGVYQTLHGFQDGEGLTDSIKGRCRRYFGTPGKAFQQKLVKERKRDPQGLRKFLAGERRAYRQLLRRRAKVEGLKPLKRAVGRAATVFAAGSLAIRYEVFLWDRDELLEAVMSCQLDSVRIAHNGGEAANSTQDLRNKLMAYLNRESSKFMDLTIDRPRRDAHELGSAPGYSDVYKGENWLYLVADQLDRIIGTGEEARQLKKELADEALLDRKASSGRFVVQRLVFKGGKGNKNHAWVCAFKARILNT